MREGATSDLCTAGGWLTCSPELALAGILVVLGFFKSFQ